MAEARCRESGEGKNGKVAPAEYATAHGLDSKLIRQIAQIHEDDQRYRKNGYDAKRQTPLDRKNERRIEKLFEHYGKYLGTSLVGTRYNSVMWAVIQHSQPETMKKYLPVVHEAVREGELPAGPLRMLIDRIQTEETGKQVFGSQVGVPLLTEAERKRIAEEYGID